MMNGKMLVHPILSNFHARGKRKRRMTTRVPRFVEETTEKQLEEEGRTRKRARKDIWQTHLYGRAVKAVL